MSNHELIDRLKSELNGGNSKKILKFLLGVASATPFVGGVFGAFAAAWSENDQDKVNKIVLAALEVHDNKIVEMGNRLVDSVTKKWVVGHIRFRPKSFSIIETSNVSSITDHGNLDFSINFSEALKSRFTLQYFGSGEVKINSIDKTNSVVRVQLLEPCPDEIEFVFINID